MSDEYSPALALPYLQPAQAQKHVTHNEALRRLDLLVQAVVARRDLLLPPASPEEGERQIVGSAAGGDWAGHDGEIALFEAGAWSFHPARPGWEVFVEAENRPCRFTGAGWEAASEQPLEVARLGIAAAPDATNRLALSASASLFSHAGAGHQLKINKAAPGETATLLFQSNWSGRTEMGLAGTDGFSIKTSADGSAWVEALSLDPASGLASGAAVVADPFEALAGKLMTSGFAGLGSAEAPRLADLDSHGLSGFWRWDGASSGSKPGATGMLLHLAGGGEAGQIGLCAAGLFWRRHNGSAWGSWAGLS